MPLSALTTDAASTRAVLRVDGLVKRFPNVLALDDVDLEIRAGEVLALMGENGSGKSTLLRVLSGDHQPDDGSLALDGEAVAFRSPADAQRAGIRVIYQEPEIVGGLDVAENLYLGQLPRRGRFVDRRRLGRLVRDQIRDMGFADAIAPELLGERLSPAQRQLVEIMRAVKAGVRLLALDEPTSSLTGTEVERLFAVVERLRDEGVAIVYVSHRMAEIARLGDRVAVLRDGRLVGERMVSETSESEIVQMMVGRTLGDMLARTSSPREEVVLRVQGLRGPGVRAASFEIRRGEVVAFAGLMGAGRSELAKTVFGALPRTAGTVEVDGRPVGADVGAAMRAGIGLAPEDRKGEALFLRRSVLENITLAAMSRLRRLRFVRRGRARFLAEQYVDRLAIRTPSVEQEVGLLSGGNQQKVVLARWLARRPSVLILDEPTRGIDVGAKAEIYRLIDGLAADGLAVMLITSELPEALGLADRIMVMRAGAIVGELRADEADEEAILRMAIGADTHLDEGAP